MPVSSHVLGSGLPPLLRELVERHQQRRTRTTADKSLARRLREGIQGSGLPVTGIAVYVHEGAVSLYGAVGDEAVRERLLQIASAQPGVRRIVDHLQVGDL